MKKLMIIALVVSMASLASAGFSFDANANPVVTEITLNVGETITLGVVAVDEVGMPLFLSVMSVMGDGALAPVANYVVDGAIMEAIPGVAYMVDTIIPGSTANAIAGTIADFQYTATAEGDVMLMLGMDIFDGSLAGITVHQVVPEPMTMALLGLGGLFLRRRRA